MFNSRRVWQIASTLVIGSDRSTLLRHLQVPFSSLHSLAVIIWSSFSTFNTLFSNLLNQFYTGLYCWFSSSTLFLISLKNGSIWSRVGFKISLKFLVWKKGGLIRIGGGSEERQGPICSLSGSGGRGLEILSRSSFALSNWCNHAYLVACFLCFSTNALDSSFNRIWGLGGRIGIGMTVLFLFPISLNFLQLSGVR